MNKKISGNQINNTKFIMQSSSINDDNSNNKTSQAINAETTNDKKNTAFDYKNITLTLTGKLLLLCICGTKIPHPFFIITI